MLGAPFSNKAKKIVILGSGELGKEVIIEAQRLGIETIAVDRYEHAPAMQAAHRSYVINMLQSKEIKELIQKEQPDFIVPEIEAIATEALIDLEQEGFNIIPTAMATNLTMDREGIRRLANETLNLPTAKYEFANNLDELKEAVAKIGTPCVIKPIMSSSGKGQTICRSLHDIDSSWNEALEGGRGKKTRVIVEEFIYFESEITLLTVRNVNGTMFCPPIGHTQKDGDYIESWQPHAMEEKQIKEAEHIAKKITDALGGYGLFGVELFLTKSGVYFSEVSPRPHDTGMVTLVTQDLSEFALHVRAILGLPITGVKLLSAGASKTIKATEESEEYQFEGVEQALSIPNTQIRMFGKPRSLKGRRMGVVLQTDENVEMAIQNVRKAASKVSLSYK
ncbi:MAG: formate-dependent phosphoribosylglycinamide formyltransferase [Bacillus sp. (in: firmicutes)]